MPRIPENIVLITQRMQHGPSRWKRWLATGVGAVALVTSFFLGVVILTLALGVAILVAVFIGFRIWWLRRQLRNDGASMNSSNRHQPDQQHTGAGSGSGRIIEGESVDISDRD